MKPNVILITIDSLRADHVSCYGYNRQTTPNIDNLVKQATLYENAYANGPNTPNSFPSIMFSRYILESDSFKIPKHWRSIANILKNDGYNTIGFNSGNSLISNFFGYGKGFDIFNPYLDQSFEWHDKKFLKVLKGKKNNKDTKSNKSKMKNILTRIIKFVDDIIIDDFTNKKKKLDKKFSSDVIEYIPELKPPFFLWLHFMDVHFPYVPDKNYLIFGHANRNSYLGLRFLNYFVRFNWNCNRNIIQKIENIYDCSILQTDKNIGNILEQLKKNRIFEDTMVIITADHGECFKEHGNFYHYTFDAYNELLRVPLIIKYPHQKSAIKIKNNVSLINLLPTITNTLKIENNSFIRGRPLPTKNKNKNEILFAEGFELVDLDKLFSSSKKLAPKLYVVIENNWKLFIDYQKNRNMLFNLSIDHNEKLNLIKSNEKILLNLINLLDDHIAKEKETIKFEKTIHKKFKSNFINYCIF